MALARLHRSVPTHWCLWPKPVRSEMTLGSFSLTAKTPTDVKKLRIQENIESADDLRTRRSGMAQSG